MHFGSYTISVLLHLALALAIFYWPDPEPAVRLDRPIMQISLTMGAPGGDFKASSILGHEGNPSPKEMTSRPAPKQEAMKGTPVPREDVLTRVSEPRKDVTAKPEPPKESAVPVPEKTQEIKVEPKKNEEIEAPRKADQKEPPKETPKKPEEKPAPKQEAAKPAEPKPAEAKKTVRDPLAEALADAAKKSGNRGRSNRGKSALENALSDFEKNARGGGSGGGGGGEGAGPGGGGIYDVYLGQVILAVRPNWSMPNYSRQNLTVGVRVKLASDGKVLECYVEKSSGRAEVDASAVNAVIRTKVLPPPPTREQQDMIINFNTLEMGGR